VLLTPSKISRPVQQYSIAGEYTSTKIANSTLLSILVAYISTVPTFFIHFRLTFQSWSIVHFCLSVRPHMKKIFIYDEALAMHIATCLSHEAEKSYDKGEIYLRIYLRVQ